MKFIRTVIIAAFALSSSALWSQTDTIKIANQQVKADTLRIQPEPTVEARWYDNKSMPWIASIFVAVITVIVNLTISYSTRRTSLKVVKTQIESSVNLAIVQFHATLNSKNRQDWINEVRNCISEFATHVRQLNIHLQDKNQDQNTTFALHEKVYLYKSKLKLLLSPKIETHSNFLAALEDLMNVLEVHLLNSKSNIGNFNNQDFIIKSDTLVEKGRQLLYFEWQKIQGVKFKASEE